MVLSVLAFVINGQLTQVCVTLVTFYQGAFVYQEILKLVELQKSRSSKTDTYMSQGPMKRQKIPPVI